MKDLILTTDAMQSLDEQFQRRCPLKLWLMLSLAQSMKIDKVVSLQGQTLEAVIHDDYDYVLIDPKVTHGSDETYDAGDEVYRIPMDLHTQLAGWKSNPSSSGRRQPSRRALSRDPLAEHRLFNRGDGMEISAGDVFGAIARVLRETADR